jgi:hypothetical protein
MAERCKILARYSIPNIKLMHSLVMRSAATTSALALAGGP